MPRAERHGRLAAAGHPGDRGRRGHAGQPPRHPRAGRPPRRVGGHGRRGAGPRRLGALRGDHPRPPAPRRDRRAAPAAPQGRGPRGRRDRRDRLRRPPGGDRGPAPGGDRLHPQAAQRRRPPHQPGADRRAAAAGAGQGAERGRLPPPGRGRRVHDRHPPARPLDRLLQPVRRAAHRLLGRRGPRPRLPRRCSCPRPNGERSPTEFVRGPRGPAHPRLREPGRLPRRLAPLDGLERPLPAPTTRTARRSSRSARTSRSSSRPRSGPCRPSGWPPSARWSPGWPTRAATPCSAARPAWRCSPWSSATGPRRST